MSLGRNDAASVYGSTPAARFVQGRVSRVSGTLVFVVCPTFDSGEEFGPVRHGGQAPPVGADCIVAVMTDTTETWIVSWDGPQAPPPLRPVAKNAAYAAQDGDYVIATGSFTITLPPPTAGRSVGVIAMTASAASPILVHTSTGLIRGPGLGVAFSGVADVYLGTPGAHVTLVADGTNWYVIDGGQDTGWLSLGPYMQAGWSDYGGSFQACQFRRDADGRVTLRGLIKYATIGSYAAFNCATLPTGWRPAATELFQVQGAGTSWTFAPFRMDIDSSGLLAGSAPSGGQNFTGGFLSLAGIQFQAV